MKKIITIPLFLFLIAFLFVFPVVLGQSNVTKTTFQDPSSGITFQYPSDWKVTTKEYVDAILGDKGGMDTGLNPDPKLVEPIVLLLPESMDGSSFLVLSELLPFPVPLEKYTELTRNSLVADPTIKLSNNLPISLGNISGLKYNVSSTINSYSQTQILFVDDSNAFVVGYTVGETEQSKNIMDINSMIGSLRID
ncbi:hypothetical protein [Candidatus Nitrosocosmicus arcticus]|uniref:PsbP C-terminal domain-containing protein n=1 Tax=Candidatus Nitrosocosmicus arcticus TaxID=2035267 RepID=A0A557SR65_9ARCH|nr:hypothetical protein [Candidatus Nitrosocosmicus arcticus]TVP39101.1 hypothetical protein NARC_210045 [Candidatus Nitrosocosmicus arcticus]